MASEPTRAARRYRAFIAYSHADARWAAWLHRRLESYRVPRRLVGRPGRGGPLPRRLGPLFRDREELASATDLGERIEAALGASDALIVVCSPDAARSRWVNEEVARFRRPGRTARVFCLIVAGEPLASTDPGREAAECFPPALRAPQADGEANVPEPLAADVRRGGDGRGLALLKLVAGLLEVDLDELRRREQQRRNRRLAMAAAASLVVAGAMAVLALEAFLSRHAAIVQRERAVAARDAAEKQRAQAEGLVAFMLGNLRSELQPIGRLDLLDLIAKRTLAYYSAQKPNTLDADSLARRAKALHLIGQVYDLRGKFDAAQSVYEKAEATTARLLARAPDDPKRIYGQALSVSYLGELAYRRGRMSQAEQYLRRYHDLVAKLVAHAPKNAQWRSELRDSDINLGAVLLKENRRFEARQEFRKALALALGLVHDAPRGAGRTSPRMGLAQTRAYLADIAEQLGDFGAARSERRKELAIYRFMLGTDPGNTYVKESVVVAQLALARLSVAQGDVAAALARLQKTAKACDELVATDSSNTFWQELAVDAYARLAAVQRDRGDLQPATRSAAHAEELARALVARDAHVPDWQMRLAETRLVQAHLEAAAGHHEAALAAVRDVLKQLAARAGKTGTSVTKRTFIAEARLVEGDELRKIGRAGSTASWRAGLAAATDSGQQTDPRLQVLEATLYLRLGRPKKARRIARHLDALDYRAPGLVDLERMLPRPDPSSAAGSSRGPARRFHPEEARQP